jgi:hypothetical protein
MEQGRQTGVLIIYGSAGGAGPGGVWPVWRSGREAAHLDGPTKKPRFLVHNAYVLTSPGRLSF